MWEVWEEVWEVWEEVWGGKASAEIGSGTRSEASLRISQCEKSEHR